MNLSAQNNTRVHPAPPTNNIPRNMEIERDMETIQENRSRLRNVEECYNGVLKPALRAGAAGATTRALLGGHPAHAGALGCCAVVTTYGVIQIASCISECRSERNP